MHILGIETSCDETAAAVLALDERSFGFSVLAEEVSSQIKLHEAYGGVVPELASREHLSNLPIVVDAVLTHASLLPSSLDLICVTTGPGLKGCLLVGVCFAKGLSVAHNIPLAAVNHVEAHLLSAMLEHPEVRFPYLGLVVSGGHTEIIAVEGIGSYRCLERTTDDAAGEAFDKAASLLGFPYPGGPALARLADAHTNDQFTLPKVMREAPGFSFSGLKTAISLLVQRNKDAIQNDEIVLGKVCAAVQDAIVDALLFKLKRAVRDTGICQVCVAGGVSANKALRKAVSGITGVEVFFPSPRYSTDNGVMIAYAGARRRLVSEAPHDWTVRSRWPVEEMNM